MGTAVTAADAEFCAEQTLTAPAVAAIIIAALNAFVNFILIVFLVCWLYPGRIKPRVLLWRDFYRFAQAEPGPSYDLEISLSVVSAKVQPLELFQPG
ncbi:MAG: hypothetical protein DME86_00740 [Verrucomicrobia bacterium]|nr:MAG: hypothetical protein DME86_00740 [Verrucomicrobiota bacterium]